MPATTLRLSLESDRMMQTVAPLTAGARWHRRLVRQADLTGGLAFATLTLLGAYFVTQAAPLQFAMYALCLVAALPHVGLFVASLRRHAANLLLVLLFSVLCLSTVAAFARVPSETAVLQGKALAATAVWASIYVVAFGSLRSVGSLGRFMQWLVWLSCAVTASVYLSALGHWAGFRFGEVLEFRDGTIRAFGPLGDQVGFILVLPALISLASSRPVMFGVHLGALLLTATRGAVACLAVGAGAYVVMLAVGALPTTRRRLMANVAVALVCGVMWLTPVGSIVATRISGTESGYLLRLTAVSSAADVFWRHPLLGVGFNGFVNHRRATAEDWFNPAQTENGLSRAANQFVQTATDGGISALLLLTLFVVWTGRNALRVARWRHASPPLIALQLWLVAMFIGNQGALWLLSNAASGLLVFAAAGVAARGSMLARTDLLTPQAAVAA